MVIYMHIMQLKNTWYEQSSSAQLSVSGHWHARAALGIYRVDYAAKNYLDETPVNLEGKYKLQAITFLDVCWLLYP